MRSSATLMFAFLMLLSAGGAAAEEIVYQYTFDQPMSWSDDAVPWGLGAVQKWEIDRANGSGGVLRIGARAYQKERTWEIRTLQFNHKPGARAHISFDIRSDETPEGASFTARYFDGYCSARAFEELADHPFNTLPQPFHDSAATPITEKWRHVSVEVGPLRHTILTIAFSVRQSPSDPKSDPPKYVDYCLDNLQVQTEALDRLMDPDFAWNGTQLSTRHLWASTAGAHLDWCTFGDQEDVPDSDGKPIHYTLLQFRDTSSRKDAVKHNFIYNPCDDGMGGRSSITLNRESSPGSCAASWGIRQTVAYSALGLGPKQTARIRLSMKMTNLYGLNGISRAQLGVDPRGGLLTHGALWETYDGDYYRDGWRILRLDFERPADATAFTIYFRHRDGKASEPKFAISSPEPQSLGSPGQNVAVADWVFAEVVK